ncbi:MAG: hypothetical protein KJ760_20110, partial [Proteobacteria bacterium]|nr:hypothetical protein [Pseudomonadota bacterium]
MTNIPQTAVGVQICIQLFVDFITFHRNQFTLAAGPDGGLKGEATDFHGPFRPGLTSAPREDNMNGFFNQRFQVACSNPGDRPGPAPIRFPIAFSRSMNEAHKESR